MISTLTVPSPIGDLVVEGDEHAVSAIRFPPADGAAPRATWQTGDDAGEPVARRTRRIGPDAGAAAAPGSLADAARQLREYFAGERTVFELTLAPERGGAFDRLVWDALARIPFGETRSYGELAAAIGRPTSVRAVGAANGRNPIPIVVPCHRVIGADGSLTGFGGGLAAKRRLLELEADAAQLALL